MNGLALAVVAGSALLGAHVFTHAQSQWAHLMVPAMQTLGAESQVSVFLITTLINCTGALLVAAMLSIPIGFAARSSGGLYGLALGVLVTCTLWYWSPPFQHSAFMLAHRTIEATVFVAGCGLFASLVWRWRRHAT
jgi:uncharacterized membrane protein required for colicin V production